MSAQSLTTEFEKVSYFQSLLISRATGKFAEDKEYESLRQELLSIPHIASMLPAWIRTSRTLDSFWEFIKARYETYAERRSYLYAQFTPILDALEFGGSTSPTLAATNNVPLVARNKRKVFIVHGRDNETKQEVARFIEGVGLQSIILHEQASSGMTIIEKIERYASEADFALVLYTPCDLGRGAHERNVPASNRARQNVVFEHGYLMAKLGRKNVCALVKGELETPNDISGVVYVGFDASGAWKMEVAKELRACGYEIKDGR